MTLYAAQKTAVAVVGLCRPTHRTHADKFDCRRNIHSYFRRPRETDISIRFSATFLQSRQSPHVSCHADVAETDFQLSLRLLFWILGSDGQLSAIAEKRCDLMTTFLLLIKNPIRNGYSGSS